MQIDRKCIQDILFTIEGESTFQDPCYMLGASKRYKQLDKYENPKIRYHLRYLEMKGLIFHPDSSLKDSYDLTPDGHDYLESIRRDN